MREHFVPGGSYCDASPNGQWAALVPNVHIETSLGTVPLCPAGNLLFLRMTMRHGLMFLAGQGHHDGGAWLWSGAWHKVSPTTGGQKVVAFGPAGLYVDVNGREVAVIDLDIGEELARVPVALGSGGIQYVTDAGEIVTGDAVYGPGAGRPFYESTTRGEIVVGGHGWSAGIVKGGPVRTVILGAGPKGTTFINFQRDGDLCAVAAVQQHGSAFRWFAVSEIPAFPVDQPPVDDPPPDDDDDDTQEPPMEWKASETTARAVADRVRQEFADEWMAAHAPHSSDRRYVKRVASYLKYGNPAYGVTGDPNWGLNGKRGTDELSEDILNYKNPAVPKLGLESYDFFRASMPEAGIVWNNITDPDGAGAKYIDPPHPSTLPGGGVVDPPPPPPPPSDIQKQLDALRRDVEALKSKPFGGIHGKRVALKSAHGTYLSADENARDAEGIPVYANRESAQSWETFTIEEK